MYFCVTLLYLISVTNSAAENSLSVQDASNLQNLKSDGISSSDIEMNEGKTGSWTGDGLY